MKFFGVNLFGMKRPGLGNSKARGDYGETLAARLLKRKGMKILGRNYRCPVGELDILALDKKTDTILFVEVKTRNDDRIVHPASAVNGEKKKRIRKIAQYYLGTHPAADYSARFDIVTVLLLDDEKPRLEHIENAF